MFTDLNRSETLAALIAQAREDFDDCAGHYQTCIEDQEDLWDALVARVTAQSTTPAPMTATEAREWRDRLLACLPTDEARHDFTALLASEDRRLQMSTQAGFELGRAMGRLDAKDGAR